jgi:hypothetical protein
MLERAIVGIIGIPATNTVVTSMTPRRVVGQFPSVRVVYDLHSSDELGHCQKCKKWNFTNKFSNEPQPTIATKIKKSLISNLGNTALTQMCLLMFCSIGLIAASIFLAVP